MPARSAHGGVQLLGTSGTVTTLAGVALELRALPAPAGRRHGADRRRGDAALASLRALGRAGLEAHPCVGPERVDFVLPGCAVFAAIIRLWPAPRVIVADRGLREGMLLRMIRADRPRTHRAARTRRGRMTQPPRQGAHAPRALAVALRTAKGRTGASQRWLTRQLNDPYVRGGEAAGLALARRIQAARSWTTDFI